jgi:phospholipid/cholesterol/gamma-HCH transport system substrate-binding protein
VVESLDDVEQLLHTAPTPFQNFSNIFEPANGALTGALAVNNFANPIAFLCGAIQAASRLGAEQSAKLCAQYLAPIVKNRQYNWPPLGFDLFVGAQARPNELTYSEEWMRPDYVPPAPAAPAWPAPGPPLAAEAAPIAPLAAESPPANEPPPATVSTDPAAGLPGLMVPPGGGS